MKNVQNENVISWGEEGYKMETMSFKVVFMNSYDKVIDIRYIDAINLSDLDCKADSIAQKLLEYSSVINWEASAPVRTGGVIK